VILAQDLRSEQDYLTCSRAGQGTPLGKAQRRQVWQLAQQVEAELQVRGQSTFLQLANEAARYLRESGEASYQHVIIDEAQDLHPAQWRLLRGAVPPGPDDMFITGDVHQRIYDNRVSLAKVGINVRGRSRKLTLNYRTTQEILVLAMRAGPLSRRAGVRTRRLSSSSRRLSKEAGGALRGAPARGQSKQEERVAPRRDGRARYPGGLCGCSRGGPVVNRLVCRAGSKHRSTDVCVTVSPWATTGIGAACRQRPCSTPPRASTCRCSSATPPSPWPPTWPER
jgi:hypothetical protein